MEGNEDTEQSVVVDDMEDLEDNASMEATKAVEHIEDTLDTEVHRRMGRVLISLIVLIFFLFLIFIFILVPVLSLSSRSKALIEHASYATTYAEARYGCETTQLLYLFEIYFLCV